jgi:hypothetical protein
LKQIGQAPAGTVHDDDHWKFEPLLNQPSLRLALRGLSGQVRALGHKENMPVISRRE